MISMYFTVVLLPLPVPCFCLALFRYLVRSWPAVLDMAVWSFLRQGFVQVAEGADELGVGGVVDRAGDHRDGVVGERGPQRGQQFPGRGDAVSPGAEALRVGDEVRV